MNVCAYARFSSSNQREESIEAQLDAIGTYCRQNGMVLAKVYVSMIGLMEPPMIGIMEPLSCIEFGR